MDKIINKVEEQINIAEQILQEFKDEERSHYEGGQNDVINNAKDNIEQLGILMNQEGIKAPRYGKTKVKRGRKSLKELKEVDGQAKEQQKISQIFNSGKGKILPKAA